MTSTEFLSGLDPNPKPVKEYPMTIQPFFNKLIISPIAPETTTAAGLEIPETAQGLPEKGTVVAIGPQVQFTQIGDTVLFGKFSASAIGKNVNLLILKETDVLGKEINEQ